jgi:hypothetical protein
VYDGDIAKTDNEVLALDNPIDPPPIVPSQWRKQALGGFGVHPHRRRSAYGSARSVHFLSARPEVKGGISWHCVVALSILLDSFGVIANPRLGMLL